MVNFHEIGRISGIILSSNFENWGIFFFEGNELIYRHLCPQQGNKVCFLQQLVLPEQFRHTALMLSHLWAISDSVKWLRGFCDECQKQHQGGKI